MNYLEQLTAEWYSYKGYLVRTNVRCKRSDKPKSEMDVLAYEPESQILVHIETTSYQGNVKADEKNFARKFDVAQNYYSDLRIPIKDVKKRAIIGWAKGGSRKKMNIPGVDITSIGEFFTEIAKTLGEKDPFKKVISESWPLLRTVQLLLWAMK